MTVSLVLIPEWAKKVIRQRAAEKGRSYHEQLSIAVALAAGDWQKETVRNMEVLK